MRLISAGLGRGLVRRFRIASLLLLVPLLVVAVMSAASLVLTTSASRDIDVVEAQAVDIGALHGDLQAVVLLGTAFLASSNPDDQSAMTRSGVAVAADLDKLRAVPDQTPAFRMAVVSAAAAWDRSRAVRDRVASIPGAPTAADDPAALEETLDTSIKSVTNSLAAAETENAVRLAALRQRQSSVDLAAPIAVAVALIVAVVAALAVSRRLALTVVGPVEALGRAARGLAAGDTGRRVQVRAADELGELGDRFNAMADQLALRSQAIGDRERRLVALVENSSDGILVVDHEGQVSFATPTFSAEFGLDPGRPSDLAALVHADDLDRVTRAWTRLLQDGMGSALEIEARLKRADGELRHVWARLTNRLDDQAVSGMVLNITDITERREFERQLSHQASHDSLTGLANRDLLRSRLERVAPEGRSAIRRVGLLYLDLDGFKQVNDTQGHDAGDQLLRHVAATMTAVMRPQDTVARLGGDEFAVLMENVSLKQAEGAAQRLLSALGSPITIGDRMVSLVVSLGIACVEKGGASDTILGDADLAMYFSKRGGKGEPRVFSPAMRIDLLDRLSLGEDLRKALASGAVAAHFQPVVDLKSGEIVGAEALARWEHPDRGWVGPNVFIPLAEEMGLVYRIDVLVLRQACALGRAMVDAGKERFRMAVNLSGSDLEQEDIVATVAAALAESGLPPANLELELTEGVAIAESGRAERVLHELKGLGVSLAIDDFGTGYSALARLRKLPFDRLKIDKAFVDEVGADREGPTLVEAILDMARVLGLEVVAEGVEKLDQASYLNERFCDFAQGYFFGRPVAAAEFAEQVRSNALPAAAAG